LTDGRAKAARRQFKRAQELLKNNPRLDKGTPRTLVTVCLGLVDCYFQKAGYVDRPLKEIAKYLTKAENHIREAKTFGSEDAFDRLRIELYHDILLARQEQGIFIADELMEVDGRGSYCERLKEMDRRFKSFTGRPYTIHCAGYRRLIADKIARFERARMTGTI
jgi:hypothetical protein